MSIVTTLAVKSLVAIEAGREAVGLGPKPMIENPFPGVPDFTSLGGRFTEWWQRLFAVLWGLGIIVAGAFLIIGLVAMAKADADNPRAHAEGRKKAMGAGIGLGCLAAVGIIIGAILGLAG